MAACTCYRLNALFAKDNGAQPAESLKVTRKREDGKTMSLYLHLFSVQNAADAKQRGVRRKNIKK